MRWRWARWLQSAGGCTSPPAAAARLHRLSLTARLVRRPGRTSAAAGRDHAVPHACARLAGVPGDHGGRDGRHKSAQVRGGERKGIYVQGVGHVFDAFKALILKDPAGPDAGFDSLP